MNLEPILKISDVQALLRAKDYRNDDERISLLNLLSHLFLVGGSPAHALKYSKRALKLIECDLIKGVGESLAIHLSSIACIYKACNNLEKSKETIWKAYEIAKKYKCHPEVMHSIRSNFLDIVGIDIVTGG